MAEFIVDAITLKYFLKAIRPVTTEIRLHATPEGLIATAADPSNVSMVTATLRKETLQNYQGEGVFGIDVEKIFSFVKEASGFVEIKLDNEIKMRSGTMSFSTLPLDPTTIRKEPKLPEEVLKRFTVRSLVDSEELIKAIKIANTIDEEIQIGRKQTLFVKAENEVEKVEIVLPEKEGSGEGSSNYNSDLLSEFLLDGTVTIDLAENFLMRLSCISNGVSWSYVIAPRVKV
ncbi:MAG: hypothetical protein QXT86_13175 [Archaeoglobaceae archaeon]